MDTRCLVSFSIGQKYFDNVWCDVVSMDACHILLGRPWQYDRGTTHDGRKNTYTFWKDNIKITLAPTKEGDSSKKDEDNLLSISKFMERVEDTGVMLMLAGREVAATTTISLYLMNTLM